MMKKALCLMAVCVMLLGCCAQALADDGIDYSGLPLLSNLTHNCNNTGIMLPEKFDPYQYTYLLTVASWVSRPRFTPTAYDPKAVITVNGKVVKSGQQSQIIPLTDEPQAVEIVVSSNGVSTLYTIYLQRRPSDRRTRVSSGYLNSIYLKDTTWHIDADLVTMSYAGADFDSGNLSTFSNAKKEKKVYDYPLNANCIFYYGDKENCTRARNVHEFLEHYMDEGSSLYTLIYIESEIVAVMPYEADY